MALNCHICKLVNMHALGDYTNIRHMNLLQSVMWPEMLYPDTNDDHAARFHRLHLAIGQKLDPVVTFNSAFLFYMRILGLSSPPLLCRHNLFIYISVNIILQAKKETNFFIENVERYQKLKKAEVKKQKQKKTAAEGSTDADIREKDSDISFIFKQKDTEEEILSRKRKIEDKGKGKDTTGASNDNVLKRAAENKKFLMNLFSGGVEASSQGTEKL